MLNLNEVIELLRKNRYKLTPQRLEIVRALVELSELHPSLDLLLRRVKERIPTISVSTLYSTILKLEELGVIKTIFIQGKMRIESRLAPHINIVDAKTGVIKDVVDEELISLIRKRLRSMKYSGENFVINLILLDT